MKHFTIVVALAGFCQALGAQTVVLDNVAPIALTTSAVVPAFTIDFFTGNIVVRSSAGNFNQCNTTSAPAITQFFSTTPGPVTSGTTFGLVWTSSNTTSCTPSQGGATIWSSLGTLPPNGSQNLTAPNVAGTLTFQLNCSNGVQSVSGTTQVQVQLPQGDCVPIYPNASNSSWAGSFGSWPAFNAVNRISGIPANGYQSWAFVATSVPGQFGSIATSGYPDDGDGFAQLSISRTPGCFTAAALGPNCLGAPNRFASIGWQNGASSNSCALTPGQTYYVNMTFGNGTSGPGPHCPGGSGGCAAEVQNQPQD